MPDPDHRKNAPAQNSERRSETRAAADQEATIKLLNPQTAGRISARVIETSGSGLKLRLKDALMPGTLVQIRVGEKLLLGEVRYCNPHSRGFQVGVRLQDVFDTGA